MPAFYPQVLFDDYLRGGTSVVIGVSGGSDSMALLDLYRLAQVRNPNLPSPFAVTIDHGLRSNFQKEAALVETYCAKQQLPWTLASWAGEKPKTGIMAAARLARYRLLANVAQDVGAKLILTGHTLDDQNETIAMRASRGEASPMERDVLFERRALISRPLLSVARAALRAHLETGQIAFADDPTNTDLRFERPRVRKHGHQSIASHVMRERDKDLVARAAGFILQNVSCQGHAATVLRSRMRDIDAEILALRYLAATFGHFEYPASPNIGSKLSALFNDGNNGLAFTAQRCRFMRVEGGILVTRDLRHQAMPLLNGQIAPFETFCGKAMHMLADALAEVTKAPRFNFPNRAAI